MVPITFDEWLKEEDEKKKNQEEEAKKQKEAEAKYREEQRRLRKKQKEDVEIIDDEDLSDCRGYKVLPDGRKTSYFTRETDAQTVDLLKKANQGPKKIDGNDQQTLHRSVSSGSAWNAAGTTFEERSQTKWVDDRLRHHLGTARCDFPTTNHICVTNVKKLSGEASIAVSRGKSRYIFDYVGKLEWEAVLDGDSYKGSINLPELSSTITDGRYEQQIKIKNSSAPSSPALQAALPKFQDAVNAAICNFVSEYQQRILR
uniref:Activator of Hsp90 ATPase AHSA1-like N-terminal domain-containing protein n=1 Tax=Aureoumbra lagunensis TaxID=44058 RepID=A0A7S3JNR7_9STRA